MRWCPTSSCRAWGDGSWSAGFAGSVPTYRSCSCRATPGTRSARRSAPIPGRPSSRNPSRPTRWWLPWKKWSLIPREPVSGSRLCRREPPPPFQLHLGRIVIQERPIARLAGPLVTLEHDAGAEGPGFLQREPRRGDAFVEHSLPLPENQGKHPESSFVDEVIAKEISDQLAAAEHQHHAVSVLLEFGHSLGNRVLDQGGVVPVQLCQCAGCHELRHGVELGCEGIVLRGIGPMRGEYLVRLAAEEQAFGSLIPFAEQRAHGVVPVVHHPAAAIEPAAPVLLRATGALHDAIDAEEIRHHEGPHGRTSVREGLRQGRQAGSA